MHINSGILPADPNPEFSVGMDVHTQGGGPAEATIMLLIKYSEPPRFTRSKE